MTDAYDAASAFLAAIDTDWQRHIRAVGPCLHQPHPARDPYESLVRAIAYQQLHAKAGDAILGRLVGLFPGQAFPRPEQILSTEVEQLRACGFRRARLPDGAGHGR
jgi:DNA-3-methyladenine glycosylase II